MRTITCYCCTDETGSTLRKLREMLNHGLTALEPVFHEEDVLVEAEEQPDWVNVYAGQNQRYEGIERDFYDDDGGDDYDWTSTSINIPQV